MRLKLTARMRDPACNPQHELAPPLLVQAPERVAPPGQLLYRGEARPVRSVVAVHTQRIGDVLNWTPFLAALRRQLPEGRLTAIVQPPGDQILRGNPAVDEVLLYRRKELRSPLGLARFVRRLRAAEADAALVIHAAEWVSVALALARIPMRAQVWRYGPEKPPAWNRLYGQRVVQQRDRPTRHEVLHNLAVLWELGVPADVGPLRFHPAPEDEAEAEAALAARGVGADDLLIAVHPGHAGGRQNWPPEHYVALGKRLAETRGARLLVTGSPPEAELVSRVAAGIGTAAVDFGGAVSLRALGAALARCRLLVSVPTGPLHLAAAVGTPVAALYGPEALMVDTVRFHPWGVPYAALRSPRGCECADYRRCADAVCLRAITPAAALAAAGRLLDAPPRKVTGPPGG